MKITKSPHEFKHLGALTAGIVAVLIISNIASTKIIQFGAFVLDGGTFLFPLAYIFGDVLTEVYGYKVTRRVIYTGFFWLAVTALLFQLLVAIPPVVGEEARSEAFAMILGLTPRLFFASLLGYWAGEFTNSYVLARLKLATQGKHLWMRTLGSTLAGQAVDTVVFLSVAFLGELPNNLLLQILVANYVFKVGIEALFTPVTYAVVRWFKQEEGIDVYDTHTNFNPFAWRDNA